MKKVLTFTYLRLIVLPFFIISSMFNSALAQDGNTINPPSFAADIFIDLNNVTNDSITVHNSTNLKVLIINMIPQKASSYLVTVESVSYAPAPFDDNGLLAKIKAQQDATTKSENDAAATASLHGNSAPARSCSQPEATITNILNADTSAKVSDAVSIGRSAVFQVNTSTDNCNEYLQRLYAAIASTIRQVNVTVNQDFNAKVTVSVDTTKTVLSTTLIQPSRKQWITSYGFGFVDNRDKNYYSKGNSTDGYLIARQDGRDDFSYSALAIFTYPFSPNKGGFEWGFSGGIGASQDNVAAMAGISFIVNKNFIITGGVTFQEFNILKGQYNEGDNVGATPIDSDVLEDQTYKAAPLIVLSYRFGAGGSGSN